ncbi:hypothetical protein QM996_17985 [Sinorhizobium chiapasense]
MNEVIPLTEQVKARHPDTGRLVTVVGVDVSSALGPKLVVLHRGPNGIFAELVDYADELNSAASA